LRDLNRPSSLSKVTFVSGQAKSGPKKAGLWRAITFQGFEMAKMYWVDSACLSLIF
jgi:hypothetical protein